MNKTILVVEDEPKIADLICKYLALEGYAYHQAKNGFDALGLFEKVKPDLVVLDIMLPGLDGLSVCERLRANSDVPIIMLTARVEDLDRLMGFAKGADDYVCKPFNPQELMARIKAILRRFYPVSGKDIYTCGPVSMNVSEHSVRVHGDEIQLTQIEFNLLNALMSHPNRVYSREELLVAGQGKYSESYERTIDFHIKNIRKKINSSADLNYIKTIYGIGYKFY